VSGEAGQPAEQNSKSELIEATIELDVPVPMRDGTSLRANVFRPAGDGRHPVLLTRLPYGKDLPLGSAVLDPVQATRRGYAIVVQDTRGRFMSDGEFEPFRGEDVDGYDTVEWAAAQPWSDGQVGMYGAFTSARPNGRRRDSSRPR